MKSMVLIQTVFILCALSIPARCGVIDGTYDVAVDTATTVATTIKQGTSLLKQQY